MLVTHLLNYIQIKGMHLHPITSREAKVSCLCVETYVGWRDELTSYNH